VEQQKEEEEEEEVNEENMLDIAEHCFYRIAEEVLKRNLTVKEAFAEYIEEQAV